MQTLWVRITVPTIYVLSINLKNIRIFICKFSFSGGKVYTCSIFASCRTYNDDLNLRWTYMSDGTFLTLLARRLL